jgi:DNA (cytosine-5)-methyltransferase 1
VTSGGHGLISPHHLGYPHTRERFFIVGSRATLPADPFPPRDRDRPTKLNDIVQQQSELSAIERSATALTSRQVTCINHWNRLLSLVPRETPLPSFPIWGDEIDATYPYDRTTPFATSRAALLRHISKNGFHQLTTKEELLEALPSYARTEDTVFPSWKVTFIRQNREWFSSIRSHLPSSWVKGLRDFPGSHRKLEWNCQGEPRDLWQYVLQFRPSGLRAKRYTSSPALVAMTTTQIPILGPKHRFLTRIEGLRLQGFPDSHPLPEKRDRAFAALGNAVHVGVVEAIARRLLHGRMSEMPPARR